MSFCGEDSELDWFAPRHEREELMHGIAFAESGQAELSLARVRLGGNAQSDNVFVADADGTRVFYLWLVNEPAHMSAVDDEYIHGGLA